MIANKFNGSTISHVQLILCSNFNKYVHKSAIDQRRRQNYIYTKIIN